MGAGQPTKYEDIYPEMLISHMETGLSFESFAGVVRVARSSIYKWVDDFQEFSDAKSIGQALATLYWEKVARDGMYNETIKSDDGTVIVRSVNASILIFTLKNRLGWRDKTESEITVNAAVEASGVVDKYTSRFEAAIKCKPSS